MFSNQAHLIQPISSLVKTPRPQMFISDKRDIKKLAMLEGLGHIQVCLIRAEAKTCRTGSPGAGLKTSALKLFLEVPPSDFMVYVT